MAMEFLRKFLFKKSVLVVVGIIIFGGGYFLYSRSGGTILTQYTVSKVQKGVLISSISTTGQVSAADQIGIKAKVGGDLVAVNIKKGQAVKVGQKLFSLDARDAERAVRDAKTSLATAELKYEELVAPPDKLALFQAENAVSSAKRSLDKLLAPPDELQLLQTENALDSAKRSLEKAKSDYDKTVLDLDKSSKVVYESAYSYLFSALGIVPTYFADLKNVKGTEQVPEKNISDYEYVLGQDAPIIEKFLSDFSDFSKKYDAISKVIDKSVSQEKLYATILEMLDVLDDMLKTFEGARNILNTVTLGSYKNLRIASTVDMMLPIVNSDIEAVNKLVSNLENSKNSIDAINRDNPLTIKIAKEAIMVAESLLKEKEIVLKELKAGTSAADIEAARASLKEKELSLEKLKAGATDLEVRNQKIVIQQNKDALASAQEKLSNYYVVSPIDGVVAELANKKGDSISAGAAVATIVANQRIAEVTLNEVDIVKVKLGQKATITFDALSDLTITGEVIDIDILGTVTQGVVTYKVKTAFVTQDEKIKPGMSLSASIITDVRKDALFVPSGAVKYQEDRPYVEIALPKTSFPVDKNSVVYEEGNIELKNQFVEGGISNDSSIEILSGLKEEDLIVTQTKSSKTTVSQTQQRQNSGFPIPVPGLGGQGRR